MVFPVEESGCFLKAVSCQGVRSPALLAPYLLRNLITRKCGFLLSNHLKARGERTGF